MGAPFDNGPEGQTSTPSSPSPSPALLPSPAQYLSLVPSTPTF
ncbi:unnamed protein product, partial [Adineta steineri]